MPATLPLHVIQHLVHTFQRYETQISGRFIRNLHELERIQRLRRGENVPAPIAMEVAIHADTQTSNVTGLEDTVPLPPVDVDRVSNPGPANRVKEAGKPVAVAPVSKEERVTPADREGFAVANAVSDSTKPANEKPSQDALWQKRRPRPIWSQ
jgi:hypothetical protein